jgi:predicted N-acyltransferase
MPGRTETAIEIVGKIGDVPASSWDRVANPQGRAFDPFVSHAFLKALEDAGTVGPRTGWSAQHLLLRQSDTITGAMPCYLKSHSRGEYIFDYGWAEAYERAGGHYYPKLQSAVPFTPVPGRRFLVEPGPNAEEREHLLAAGAIEVAKRHEVSSLHVTFLSEGEWTRLGALGMLQRTDKQFHWHNEGYRTFEDFIATLASRKRKTVRKEREQALSAGLTVEWVTGSDLTEAHWDAFFRFYMDTGSRKWGSPYLNRKFFSLLGTAMPGRCLLILARRAGRYVAGALNLIGGDCLYGRYWGMVEHHPCLHFEVCYYQAIEFAITHGLARVEAGAQGEHKLARGYMPVPTYSLHWIRDAGFRRAVQRYLEQEREDVSKQRRMLAAYGPYKRIAVTDEA